MESVNVFDRKKLHDNFKQEGIEENKMRKECVKFEGKKEVKNTM